MELQRWRQVSRLFHDALTVPARERSLFLERACGEDLALRAEVESLLARDASASFPGPSVAGESERGLEPADSAAETMPAPGEMFGNYRIERELGHGGMGVVLLAYDTHLHRHAAIKVLRAAGLGRPSAGSLIREARNAAALNHPNICTVYEVGEAGGTPFIVMEYVEGKSLRLRLDEGAIPMADVLRLGRQAADALAYAHDRGVVHRDFKAANAIVTSAGLKIIDFGLARRVDPGDSASTQSTLAPAGAAVGTPAAMAPEQVRGEAADARTDLWALGALLYEMASGVTPFRGSTIPELFSAILRDPPAPLPAAVPAGLATIVERCLQKEPAERYQRASEVRAALEAVSLETPSAAAARTRTVHTRRALRLAAVGLAGVGLLAAALNLDLLRSPSAGGARGPAFTSLAVLPLEHLSGDQGQDYFTEGMHEALIVGLGKLSGLKRVIARPSVLRYRTVDRPLAQIAGELGVEALITGTVLRSGNRVRITAQLVDPKTERQLWGESYEREERDVLSLQNDVVAAIAEQVRLQLSPREEATLSAARRVNPDAYQAYLKGAYQLNTLTPDSLEAGIAFLRQAVAIDPAEPLAYAGLARAYSLREVFSPSTSRDDSERARAAALKALELDPGLAEAHAAVATYKFAKEWDYAGSEHSFRQALGINPNLAETHITYAQYLNIFGTEAEALAEWKRGTELDPLSPLYAAWFGSAYWEFGRVDDAIRETRRALDIQPDFQVALFVLVLAHLDEGRYAEAIAVQEKLLLKYPRSGHTWGLARAYALAGRRAEARQLLAGVRSTPAPDLLHPWFIAAAYTALDEHDEAMNWLESAFDLRIGFLTNIARDRAAGFDLRPLRSNPRFQALLRKMNLTRAGRSPG